MSLDSGTYILECVTADGNQEYRVAPAFAIENIWNKDSGMKSLYSIFKESPAVQDFFAALDIAEVMEREVPTEHGVLVIRDFKDLTFITIAQASDQDGQES